MVQKYLYNSNQKKKCVCIFFLMLYNSRMNWTENLWLRIIVLVPAMKMLNGGWNEPFAFDFYECHDTTELNRSVECYKYVTILHERFNERFNSLYRFKMRWNFQPPEVATIPTPGGGERKRETLNMNRLGKFTLEMESRHVR